MRFGSEKTVIIGERCSGMLEHGIMSAGAELLLLPDNPDVGEALAGHADLSVFYPGDHNIFLAEYLKESKTASEIKALGLQLHFIPERQGRVYPLDVPLNVRVVDCDTVIMNPDTASSAIKEYCQKRTENAELRIISVRQGYSACAALSFGKGIITSDSGIERAAQRNGIPTLKISPGGISLPGYEYGFIGGSAFMLHGKMYFTGSLKKHPDGERIVSFLSGAGIESVFLSENDIFDIGGAIVI